MTSGAAPKEERNQARLSCGALRDLAEGRRADVLRHLVLQRPGCLLDRVLGRRLDAGRLEEPAA